MRLKRVLLSGTGPSVAMATMLVEASKWFAVTPFPDDQWEFIAKNEPGLPNAEDWRPWPGKALS